MLRLSKNKGGKRQTKKVRHPVRWAVVVSTMVCLAAGVLFSAYWLYSQASGTGFTVPFIGGIIGKDESNIESPAVPDQTFEEYLADTVFIGDSRTNGLTRYGFVSQGNVYAIDGFNHVSARTQKFLVLSGTNRKLTIAEAVGLVQPTRVIVSFGINGIAFMDSESFMSEYAGLLDDLKAASPDTLLVVQSILPVSANKAASSPGMSNRAIDSCNQKLKALTEEKGGIFLDSSGVLKDAKGNLASQYDSGDGLHLNKPAYQALLDFYDKNRIY